MTDEIETLKAQLIEAEACARCEHEKRLGIEQQRDELLSFAKEFVEAWSEGVADDIFIYNMGRAAIAKVEGVK